MPTSARKTPAAKLEKVQAVISAVERYDIAESAAWADLDALSTHTYFDGIDVDPAGVTIEGDRFRGVMNVYVLLRYGKDNDEGFESSDSFLGKFSGRFVNGVPRVETVSVNTEPFYA